MKELDCYDYILKNAQGHRQLASVPTYLCLQILHVSGFLDEVPPRLEGCRQRLLAAEIELGRAEKAGGLDIGNSAPPEADDVPAVLQDLPPLFGPEDGPDEFADLPHEGEMLLEQVSELESQLTSMTGKFKDLDAGHLAARQLRNSYSAQITSSTEQISSLAKRISELTEQLDVSQKQNEALKGNVIASRENTQKLQKQLLDCGKELSLSQYQGSKLEQLVESTRAVVDDYRSKLEQSETEHQNLRDRLRDTEKANRAAKDEAEQRIEELEEALQEAEERMQEVTAGKEDLERQKKDLVESLQSQKDATIAQEKIVQDLQKFKLEEERLKENMQKDLEQRQKQIDTLSIQLEEMTAQTKQDQPEADHATGPEASEEEIARIKKLEEALREAEKSIDEVKVQKDDIEKQKQELTESLQSQKDATAAQEKLVEEKEKELAALNRKLDQMQKAEHGENQPEADHATGPEASEEEMARIKKLEEALREAEKSTEEVKVQKDDIEKQKQDLTESLQSQKDATAAQEKLVEEKEKELAALNRKLDQMQKVEHGENQPEADHATGPEASEEEMARIKKLEEALREAEKSIDEVKVQKDDIEKQKQELTESLQSQKDATVAQEKLVEEKEKELAALNRKLDQMQKVEHGENQPEADHATGPEASEEEIARIKKLEEALREAEKSIDEVKVQKDDIEKQKQELTESLQSQKDATVAQEKLVEEKEKELAALNRKLDQMQKVEHGENQPEADHATGPEASEEEMARIKKLEEALREAEKSIDEVKVQKDDIEKQKQELTESLQSQKDATVAQEKLVEEKEKELAALSRKLDQMQKVAKEEPVADSIAEEPDPAESAAKQAVSQWVDSATQVERSASKAQQEEWLSEWDSENVSLAVPVVMAAGVYEHGRAPSRVGLKGADFLIQPLLPAGPPQRLKLSNVMSIFAESHAETQMMSQSVSLVLDVDEGGQKRQLQLSSDEESAEAILATLTRDVRVMPGEELKGR